MSLLEVKFVNMYNRHNTALDRHTARNGIALTHTDAR